MPKNPPATPRTPAPRGGRRNIPTAKPEDIVIGRTLDLNARAAARAKVAKVAPKVKVGTVTYDLPLELKLNTLDGLFAVIDGDINGLKRLLWDFFGHDVIEAPTDEELAALEEGAASPAAGAKAKAAHKKAHNPAFGELTVDDLAELFAFISEGYGIDLGNSPASTDS